MSPDLLQLLTTEIPTAPKFPDSFLDLTWQSHRETIISRIYGYFLTPSNNREIAKLFVSSLLELIEEACNKQFDFEGYSCALEEVTKKGNRIDILIRSEETKEAIIIENKIYHGLFNDLLDYWDYSDYPEENKIGVILTLNNCSVPSQAKGKYINITHGQWVGRIKQKGIPACLSTNEYVYLTDFIKNMERLSQSQTMNEQAKFFFEHTDKVLKAQATYAEAEKYILNELTKTSVKLATDYNDIRWHLGGNGWQYRHIWDGVSHAYYIIGYEDLLAGEKKVNIILEIYKDGIKREKELIDALKDCKEYSNLYTQGRKTPHWIHFATYKYDINNTELERLGEFIYDRIKNDFEPVMNIVLDKLSNKV